MKSTGIVLIQLFLWITAYGQTEEDLKQAAAAFPPMPRGTAGMSEYASGLPTFSSGAPFNDLEFTLLDTDYMDGENSGGDAFMPVDPSHEYPGGNKVKYVRCILNTDLNEAYGSANADRIILGTAEIAHPFFRKGSDGLDNDYAVIQHLDFEVGYIQLKGIPEDYDLIYCTEADGCETEGWYLFYTADGGIDLIAFIYPCWDIEPSVSGNPPNSLNPICNSDSLLSLTNPNHFKYAQLISTSEVVADGIAQYGSSGKEIVSGITVDREGYIYLFGCSDGNLDGQTKADNEIFVTKLHPDGEVVWVTEIPMAEGTILKDANTDNQFLYACGRTLGNLPGFSNAGRWDGFLIKLDLATGDIVATNQWGNPGIDGYGNLAQDDAGNIFVSAQGSPSGPATNDEFYLVAKHRKADLSNVWRALNAPNVSGFKASAEAWGGLTFVPSGIPGEGRLITGGWYFGPRGANAFVSVYENLNSSSPSRPQSIIIDTPGTAADWVLDNVVDKNGNIYVAGFTTGNMGSSPLGEGDAYIIKYSPQLTNPIIRQFGTTKSDLIRKLAIDDDGIIYAVGYTYGNYVGANQDPENRTGDILIQKFDNSLNYLEANQIGTPHEDRAFLEMKYNNLYIGGITEGVIKRASQGSFDAFAFSLDPRSLTVTKAGLVQVVTSLSEVGLEKSLALYPNPSSDYLYLDFRDSSRDSYEIFSADGKRVLSGDLSTSQAQISVHDLQPGIYVINLKSDHSAVIDRLKFIKQ